MSMNEENKNNNSQKTIRFLQLPQDKKEKVVILLLIGVFFLLIANPFSKNTNKSRFAKENKKTNITTEELKNVENDEYIEKIENKLEQTIEGMAGAGKVHVMITLQDSGEKVLDKNQPYESSSENSKDDGKESQKTAIASDSETVLIDVEGNTSPIVIQEKYPDIEGVVVVCEGGDNTTLALQIKEVVQALFSVDPHKVVVCKLQL